MDVPLWEYRFRKDQKTDAPDEETLASIDLSLAAGVADFPAREMRPGD